MAMCAGDTLQRALAAKRAERLAAERDLAQLQRDLADIEAQLSRAAALAEAEIGRCNKTLAGHPADAAYGRAVGTIEALGDCLRQIGRRPPNAANNALKGGFRKFRGFRNV